MRKSFSFSSFIYLLLFISWCICRKLFYWENYNSILSCILLLYFLALQDTPGSPCIRLTFNPLIKQFSKESWFLLLEDEIWKFELIIHMIRVSLKVQKSRNGIWKGKDTDWRRQENMVSTIILFSINIAIYMFFTNATTSRPRTPGQRKRPVPSCLYHSGILLCPHKYEQIASILKSFDVFVLFSFLLICHLKESV